MSTRATTPRVVADPRATGATRTFGATMPERDAHAWKSASAAEDGGGGEEDGGTRERRRRRRRRRRSGWGERTTMRMTGASEAVCVCRKAWRYLATVARN
jgi:hypothetical protein